MAAVWASAAIAMARSSAPSPHLVQERARIEHAARSGAAAGAVVAGPRKEIHHALVERDVAARREVQHGRVLDHLR